MSPSAVDPVTALVDAVRTRTTAGAAPELGALHEVLAQHFSRVFAQLERVAVPGYPHALLLRWRGSGGADGQAAPLVLLAHQDVVPAGAEGAWTHPPFAGVLASSAEGEAVWGRGTLDDKGPLVVVLAAVEALLAEDFVPARDVWLSFGSDEETGGASAVAAVGVLRERGVSPWAVLDEGGAVAAGALPGLRAPLAVVGVTEKGSTVLRLVARGRGGHASTPARGGPVARLARAVVALERAERRAALGPVTTPAATRELLRRVLPRVLPQPLGGLVARFPEVAGRLLVLAGPESAAMVRTTLAFTAMHGSEAVNAVPDEAWVGINARVVVGDSVDDVVARIRSVVAGCGVEVEIIERGEPSPSSPFSGGAEDDDEAFALLERCTAQVFPDAVSTPYVVMAATDARSFTALTRRVYRFSPLRMSRAQRASIHGVDEHVAVADLLDGVRWTTALLRGLP